MVWIVPGCVFAQSLTKPKVVFLQKKDYKDSYVANFYISDKKVNRLRSSGVRPLFSISKSDLKELYANYNPDPKAPLVAVLFNREKDDYAIPASYIYSVIQAGARVRVLSFEDIEYQLEDVDGILLTGGDFDWPLDFFAQKPKFQYSPPGKRYKAYTFLINYAVQHKIPLFGICAGMEAMGFLLGEGKVKFHNDIASITGSYHRNVPATEVAHTVQPVEGGRLARIVGNKAIKVNSRHFQGTTPLLLEGSGVKVSGLSEDGVVEAIEFTQYPNFFAVQFHPEVFAWQGDENSLKIFDAFVQDARAYHVRQNYAQKISAEIFPEGLFGNYFPLQQHTP